MSPSGYTQPILSGVPPSAGLEQENQHLKQLISALGETLQQANQILAQAGPFPFQSHQCTSVQDSRPQHGSVTLSHHGIEETPDWRRFPVQNTGTEWSALQFSSAFPSIQPPLDDSGRSGNGLSQAPDGMEDWLAIISTPKPDDRLAESYMKEFTPQEQTYASRHLSVPKPSLFCQDILHFEGMIKYIMLTEPEPDVPDRLDMLIEKMLHTLVSEDYWHWTKAYFTESLAWKHVGPITRFRIEPTKENYDRLPARFRPSQIQLTRFHWPIIDWILWPQLRDKLILQSAEYDLTDFISTIIAGYCLEAEITEETEEDSHGHGMTRTAVRGQGRLTHMSQSRTRKKSVYYRLQEYLEYTQQLPAETTLTEKRTQGALVSDVLEAKFLSALQADQSPFKLEPTVFERFPSLYVEDAVAHGVYRSIFSPHVESTRSRESR
ncbi:hypothetical protein AYO21_11748 [Fonsecaea monophora]|uniref:Uncharacterized protein n=1 Tax=Fonsecaea monophora TaxID=254056 RepID=A0A177EQ89_9EURO|nr:hypothetical protein AYO21_11748 [Fonsecaea monophora]OAG34107.1 hypothetical protein AYO21_11748 [Fonsecaea monophora]